MKMNNTDRITNLREFIQLLADGGGESLEDVSRMAEACLTRDEEIQWLEAEDVARLNVNWRAQDGIREMFCKG